MSELFRYTNFPDEPAEFESAEDETEQLREQLRAQAARVTALEAAVEQARELLTTLDWNDWDDRVDAWLAAHPAPQADQEKVK